jgi:hypothetical protein
MGNRKGKQTSSVPSAPDIFFIVFDEKVAAMQRDSGKGG